MARRVPAGQAPSGTAGSGIHDALARENWAHWDAQAGSRRRSTAAPQRHPANLPRSVATERYPACRIWHILMPRGCQWAG